MVLASNVGVPPKVSCRRFLLREMAPGQVILDVGCGGGELMRELADMGCSVSGVDSDASLVSACRERGLAVSEGKAECLPQAGGSVDGIVCSVTLPYTDERRAIAEWARVLRPGGGVNVTCHGVGYGLRYLLHPFSWKMRLYGLRMLINTAAYGLTRRRLPGFLGDTLCQTSRRLRKSYRQFGLLLADEQVFSTFLGCDHFLAQRVIKPAGSNIKNPA